jgi:membrane peptidoglycan carboxypeptidase
MRTRVTSLQLPSLRRSLLRVHQDLFVIDEKVPYYTPEHPLSLVEIFVLILEDRRFFRHRGVDWRSCVREVVRAILGQRYGGASTIDMQFVRTATGFRERTISRKLHEILLAILIQYRYSKREILRSYLSCAFFGSHLYGIEHACLAVYGKRSDDLTENEAADIAAMLVYPRPLSGSVTWRLNVSRRANYAKRLRPSLEKRFQKLPGWEEL